MEKPVRLFYRERFRTTKEWIYFCLEFGLQLCDGCFAVARKGPSDEPWQCGDCRPQLHPDLVAALRLGENVMTSCDLCAEEVALRDCWISDDCQRLYCASHLEPLRTPGRVLVCSNSGAQTRTGRWIRRETSQRPMPRLRARRGVSRVSCRAIYDGDRILELDRPQ